MEGTIRKKNKSWYYRFDVATANGKRRQIERYAGKTRKEARAHLEKPLLCIVIRERSQTRSIYQ